jgi:RHS repeat-associated protein
VWLCTTFEYGPFGLATSVSAPDDTVQTVRYDVRGRRDRLVDPSSGTTITGYNAFGEVTSEIDGTGATTTYVRDALGRIKTATSPDGRLTNTWDTAANGIGKLASADSPDSVFTQHAYDEFGRQTLTSWKIDGVTYAVNTGYDGIGRRTSVTYPNIPGAAGRLKVNYSYNTSGYLAEVRDAAAPPDAPSYWKAEGRDPAGQLTRERYGNEVVTDYTYEPATGLLDTITATGPGTVGKLGELDYGYDLNRNVNLRHDKVNNRHEAFVHDELNRLERWQARPSATGNPMLTNDYTYNEVGNLQTDRTTRPGRPVQTVTHEYGYEHPELDAPPHALVGRDGAGYTYDDAGRQLTGPNRTVTYNTLDLPKTLAHSNAVTQFKYDAAGARALKRDTTRSAVTAGEMFERRSPAGHASSEIHNLHNIVVDGRIVTQVNRVQPAAGGAVIDTRVLYLHADRQGSTTLVTNANGRPYSGDESVFANLFYDPWGRRIDSAYEQVTNNRTGGPRQLYTGQYHDDEIYLVNMRGRMYDPHARRFITPDSIVPDPLNGQDHNRYAYVGNNPTTLTDPSGHFGEGGGTGDRISFGGGADGWYAAMDWIATGGLDGLSPSPLDAPLVSNSPTMAGMWSVGNGADGAADGSVATDAEFPTCELAPECTADDGSDVDTGEQSESTAPTTITIWVNSFIPKAAVGLLAGDDRDVSNDIDASHRTHQEVEIDIASGRQVGDSKHMGTSHVVVPSGMLPPPPSPAGPWAIFSRPAFTPIASGTASTDDVATGPVTRSGRNIVVHFEVDSSVPLIPGAPAINLTADFHVNLESRSARLVGTHDGFPAYEAYISVDGGPGTAIYQYNPFVAGEGPFSLFPPMEHSVATPWTPF